jgi:hypothetical protein
MRPLCRRLFRACRPRRLNVVDAPARGFGATPSGRGGPASSSFSAGLLQAPPPHHRRRRRTRLPACSVIHRALLVDRWRRAQALLGRPGQGSFGATPSVTPGNFRQEAAQMAPDRFGATPSGSGGVQAAVEAGVAPVPQAGLPAAPPAPPGAPGTPLPRLGLPAAVLGAGVERLIAARRPASAGASRAEPAGAPQAEPARAPAQPAGRPPVTPRGSPGGSTPLSDRTFVRF